MANRLPNPVERLRYFDGEYLRSYDFTDEQSYHIEMRRLMNRRLHLHGIAYGLRIEKDQDSAPPSGSGYAFYSIQQGLAIDPSGREIVVPAPYSLNNVLTQPGLGSFPNKWAEVWICYSESETGLPAAGYIDCNAKNQYTRWQEKFKVVLKPTHGPSVVEDCGGVRLGVVKLIQVLGAWQIVDSSPPLDYNVERTYVGIRAQRVIAPNEEKDLFDMTGATTNPIVLPIPFPQDGYLDIQPTAVERGNLFVEKNVLIGKDFDIDTSTFNPAPTIPPDGNLVVSNDLFLQGSFYGFNPNAKPNPQWLTLQQLIQLSVPNIQTGPAGPVPIGPDLTGSGTGSFPLGGPITAPFVTNNAQVMLAITGIDWFDPKDFATFWTGNATDVAVSVTASFTPSSPGGSNQWNLTINWQAGPPFQDSPGHFVYPVRSVNVTYIAVFLPPS